MAAQQIDTLLKAGGQPLYVNHKDLYKTIDTIQHGDVKWQGFGVKYIHNPEDGVLVRRYTICL
ncbi:hypothetical protein JVU11DRAFT_10773 [Chiua virens]|nr:hypothetical protein JVU11DRAFT_10773 [Chiua virens]